METQQRAEDTVVYHCSHCGAMNRLLRARLGDELPAALERLRLAGGIDAGPGRVLLVARDEQPVELAPATGWSVERISLEDAAAIPAATAS